MSLRLFRTRGRLLLLTVVALTVLAVPTPVDANATGESTEVGGLSLPAHIVADVDVTDSIIVSGPPIRAVRLQHRAPGEVWRTLAVGNTDSQREAVIRIRAIESEGGRWVWRGGVNETWGQPLWTAPPEPTGAEQEFRVTAPRTDGWRWATSTVATVRVAASDKPPDEPTEAPEEPPARVCDSDALKGPVAAPPDAVVVRPGDDLSALTSENPPGTMFYLTAGTHTLPEGEYAQVIPKSGNTYIGAPGAVLDGRGKNRYAFTQHAENVTIEHLTVRGFRAPNNEFVVNHDAGDRWVIRANTVEQNDGAGVGIGDGNVVEDNCLRDNGQYGFSAFEPDGVRGIVLRGNEISGNNTGDWESVRPGCGCSGGGKFWSTIDAVVEGNYVHDNRSVGLWADGLNSDFLIRGNYIADNDGPGIMYEQGYNASITDNTLAGNTHEYGAANPAFPEGAIYISEAGADPRAPGGHETFEIARNVLVDNWGGVTLWENSDRFAGSPADTSGAGTLIPGVNVETCSDPARIESEPYYSDCRWSTKNVKVHHNVFRFDPANVPGCDVSGDRRCGHMGVGSNWGTFPEWSPYQGSAIQQSITYRQGNEWFDNAYQGPWEFVAEDIFSSISWDEWTGPELSQDRGSTFVPTP